MKEPFLIEIPTEQFAVKIIPCMLYARVGDGHLHQQLLSRPHMVARPHTRRGCIMVVTSSLRGTLTEGPTNESTFSICRSSLQALSFSKGSLKRTMKKTLTLSGPPQSRPVISK